MTYRQWYAQLDVFDTVRRYLALLHCWKTDAPCRERLLISDFYFVNPCLLHLTHMTSEVRRVFTALNIPKPDNAFIKPPSPPILYNKMSGIQAQALYNLIGKGLCEVDLVENDQYILSFAGNRLADELGGSLILPGEERLLAFLTTEFATIGRGSGGLRAVTGLRRLGA
jgi:hypothetical protein